MEHINIAELLRDCPAGMELDCTMFEGLEFVRVDNDNIIRPIMCRIKHSSGQHVFYNFTKYGCWSNANYAKCVIFPKGKNTWEEFHRPFKDGDIVVYDDPHRNNLQIFIFKNKKGNNTLSSCYLMLDGDELDLEEGMYYITRLATKEEKEKLFRAIKDNGYRWNDNTKTLEKLIEPKFKDGDWVVDNCGYVWKIKGILNQFYLLESVEGCESRPTIDWVDKTFHLWTIQDVKDGDVLANDKHILIFKELGYTALSNGKPENLYAYCGIKPDGSFELGKEHYCFCGILHTHPATKEQRNTLFTKMKETGYKWNDNTKTLEKLIEPKFKDGDIIVDTLGGIHIMQNSTTSYCYFDRLGILDKTKTTCVRVERLANEEEKQKLFQAIKDNGYRWNDNTKTLEKLTIPKFKVGDRIKNKNTGIYDTVIKICEDCYLVTTYLDEQATISFDIQDNWEIAPSKFDISNLTEFDKVLVRDNNAQKWFISFFSHYNNELEKYKFSCVNDSRYIQCIPYKQNKHLSGKSNECEEYYKNW